MNITRRGFMKALGLGAVATAGVAVLPEVPPIAAQRRRAVLGCNQAVPPPDAIKEALVNLERCMTISVKSIYSGTVTLAKPDKT